MQGKQQQQHPLPLKFRVGARTMCFFINYQHDPGAPGTHEFSRHVQLPASSHAGLSLSSAAGCPAFLLLQHAHERPALGVCATSCLRGCRLHSKNAVLL